MDLIQSGIDWIVAIQGLGAWLEAPMKFITNLGSEDFFFLVLPLIYWCIDARLGLRVAMILAVSNNLKPILKMAFAGPRPYWVSEQVKALVVDGSFGIPSGHSQDAVALWGIMAVAIRKRWAWIAALILAFLIGFSRLYLGAHFVHDVLAGWLIGGILLWAFVKFWDPFEARLKKQSLGSQVLLAFIVSVIFLSLSGIVVGRLGDYVFPEAYRSNALRPTDELPEPVSMEGSVTSAGAFFGLTAGAAWITARGGYQATGPVEKRALRFVVGLIGILILWRGLALFLPDNADLISYVFRYIRYTLVGFWVLAGAPWLFFRIKLAKSNM